MNIKKTYLYFLTLVIILFGIFLRLYNIKKNVDFGWDQETTAIKILEMVKNKKPLLIGPRVGPAKFFLGPLYYYITALFLLISRFDTIGLYYCSALIGGLTGILIYYLGKKIFNEKIAFLSLIIYYLSPFLITYDRIPWNVNLIILSSLLTFFAIFKIFVKNKENIFNYYTLGLGIGLGLHSHLTFAFFFIILLFFVLIKRKLSFKLIFSFLIIFLLFLPLIVFDFRHDFFNLRMILEFLKLNSEYPIVFSFKERIFKNLLSFLELPGKMFLIDNHYWLGLFPGIVFLVYLFKKAFLEKSDRKKYQAIFIYLFLPILLLGFYRGEIPEYYLFLQVPVLIFLIADFLVKEINIFSNIKKLILLLSFFVFLSLQKAVLIKNINEASLFYKEKVANYILASAKDKKFKISYIMDKGKNVGFNYFFKLNNNLPDKASNLEFIVVYPICSEIRREDYYIIGAFGVKEKESSFDKLYYDYFNKEYFFALDIPKNFTVIDCSFDNSYKEFIIVDKKQGSCFNSHLEDGSDIRFLTGNDEKTLFLYSDFNGEEKKIKGVRFKENKQLENNKAIKKLAFLLQRKKDKSLLFYFQTDEERGKSDKQFSHIIESLKTYAY